MQVGAPTRWWRARSPRSGEPSGRPGCRARRSRRAPCRRSRLLDPGVAGRLDEEVVEAATQRPAEVDRVVEDELLELLVGEILHRERGPEVLGRLLAHAGRAGAADRHDPPVSPGEVLGAGPDLPVEEVAVAPSAEGRRRRRDRHTVNLEVGRHTAVATGLVVVGAGPPLEVVLLERHSPLV